MKNNLCVYGCGKLGEFSNIKTGALRCSKNPVHCPSLIKKGNIAGAAVLAQIDENTGLTKFQLAGRKTISLAKNKIDPETGKSLFMLQCSKGGIGSVALQRANILPSGLNQLQARSSKILKERRNTFIDGVSVSCIHARKAAETRRSTIGEDGLTTQERINLRINVEVDETGMTKSERGLKKSSKIRYYDDFPIWYQSKYELQYLSRLRAELGDDNFREQVQRGCTIRYSYQGKKRNYHPDFLVGHKTLVEIKSVWTWDRKGKDVVLREKNICKMRAAIEAGFEIVLVLEGREYPITIYNHEIVGLPECE